MAAAYRFLRSVEHLLQLRQLRRTHTLPEDPEALQDRLTNLNNDGRLVQWELALKNFGKQPLEGSGAGTFARVWAQEGNGELKVVNPGDAPVGKISRRQNICRYRSLHQVFRTALCRHRHGFDAAVRGAVG